MITIEANRKNGKLISAHIVDTKEGYKTTYENRNDWKTFEAADEVAQALGSDYLPADHGSHVSPRYDVIKKFKVGEEVSYGFNGDSYICGTIKSITASQRKIVAGPDFSGKDRVFWRRRQSSSWVSDQTWSLFRGHTEERNPSF